MPGLTETDKERIKQVAKLPRYRRSPDLLMPEGEKTEQSDVIEAEKDRQ